MVESSIRKQVWKIGGQAEFMEERSRHDYEYGEKDRNRDASGDIYVKSSKTNTSGSRYANKNETDRSSYGSKKRRRRRNHRQTFNVCLVVFLILAAVCISVTLFLYQSSERSREPGTVEPAPIIHTVDLELLDSPYAILLDADTGEVLSSRRGEEKIFPASLVKIMTVLTAIEHIEDLDRKITMSYDYYDMLYERDASRAGFEPGEKAVIRDLLYGALLPSGAECCMELAVQAAGSEAAFTELMNERARSLGLTQTHFTNCTGLHNDEQYSTAKEIAQILCEAVKNKTFYQVFTTPSYTVKATDMHPDGFTFRGSMFKAMDSPEVTGGKILGGKTGYTDEAGRCLASMAEIDGRGYILVTAGWAAEPRTEQYHVNDAFLAYNQIGE